MQINPHPVNHPLKKEGGGGEQAENLNFSEKIRQDESGRRNGFFVEIGRFIISPLPPSVTAGGGMGREKGGGRREGGRHSPTLHQVVEIMSGIRLLCGSGGGLMTETGHRWRGGG